MLTIRKSIGLIALLVVLGASGTAQAKGKVTHKYTSTVQTATLATGDGYPAPGGTAVIAGTLQAKPLGSGAVVDA